MELEWNQPLVIGIYSTVIYCIYSVARVYTGMYLVRTVMFCRTGNSPLAMQS